MLVATLPVAMFPRLAVPDELVRDAVEGGFFKREKPASLRRHFVEDLVLSVA